ncbi:MAG: ATP synthase F1 subunit epsilon [Tissierellia bacterium]|nr:ATP synthase F1 subunit epsilon [Tissierellia bacterium]
MITLRLVTPSGSGFEEEVERAILRGSEGDLAVMEGTAPIVTPLEISLARVIYPGRKERTAAIHGGYMSMKNNVLTVVADHYEWSEDIDLARAKESERRAKEMLQLAEAGDDLDDVRRAELALSRALTRIRVKEGSV